MQRHELEALSDEELVRNFVGEGDREVLDILLRRHEARVYGLAYRILGTREDALDATQDAFLNVFRKIGSFRHQSSFSTWMHRLAINASYDLARKRRPSTELTEVADSPASLGPGDSDLRLDVERALALLPEDQRTAVVLRDLYGLSYEELAEIIEVPVGTVKSRIARGRAALGAVLENEERSGGDARLTAEDT